MRLFRIAVILLYLVAGARIAMAAEKIKFHDWYLTEERVCKACHARWINNHQISLVNREGLRAVVESGEVLGVDNHPVVRKLLYHSATHQGLAGKVLVPSAFDDWRDFVCKYDEECDPTQHNAED